MDTSEIVESVGLGTAQPYVKKFSVVALDDLGYEGWAMRVWCNAPRRYYQGVLEAPKTDEETEAWIARFFELVPEWNFPLVGGAEGEIIPRSADGLNQDLPSDLLAMLAIRVMQEGSSRRGLDPQNVERSSPTSPDDSLPTEEAKPEASPSPERSAVIV